MGFSRLNRIGALLIALQPDLAQGAEALTGSSRTNLQALKASWAVATGVPGPVVYCFTYECVCYPFAKPCDSTQHLTCASFLPVVM